MYIIYGGEDQHLRMLGDIVERELIPDKIRLVSIEKECGIITFKAQRSSRSGQMVGYGFRTTYDEHLSLMLRGPYIHSMAFEMIRRIKSFVGVEDEPIQKKPTIKIEDQKPKSEFHSIW